MRLVLASLQLSARGGSETYLVTVARELARLGHEITMHADAEPATLELADGIRRSHGGVGLPEEADAVLVQDGVVSFALAERFPSTPQVFISHSSVHDLQAPPQLADLIGAIVVMNERVHDRMRALAATPSRIVRLTQPVSFDVFAQPSALAERPRRLLSLGNRLEGNRRAALAAACEANGIEFVQMGALAADAGDPTTAVADADIVVGYGRCIVEAMMAGRAAYVFDHQGGDGWITEETYEDAEADGFVGRSRAPVRLDQLAEDLGRYDATMGVVNRDLALRHHDAADHARQLVEIVRSLAPREARLDHAAEFARLARLAWQWESDAIRHQRVIDARVSEVRALEEDLAGVRNELDFVHADRALFEASGSFRLARLVSRMVPRRRNR